MTTCCERHKINCDQGRQCPARGVTYSVRVVRPGQPLVEYDTRALSSIDAINAAMDKYGNDGRVSAERAFR